jgi:hypothetical protein
MKNLFTIVLLVGLFVSPAFGQSCATPFANPAGSLVETCSQSGAAGPYTIIATEISDTTLTFEGLWEVPQGFVTGEVECDSNRLTIPRQPLMTSFDIEGTGYVNNGYVTLEYQVFATDSLTPVDVCTATYQGTAVGLSPTLSAQLTLAPNPAHDVVQVHAKGLAFGVLTYRVVDVQGRVLRAGLLDDRRSTEIELIGLAQGIYRVVVQDEQGQIASRALVVE